MTERETIKKHEKNILKAVKANIPTLTIRQRLNVSATQFYNCLPRKKYLSAKEIAKNRQEALLQALFEE